jgi:hypothetical protein
MQICPNLSDLMGSISKIESLPLARSHLWQLVEAARVTFVCVSSLMQICPILSDLMGSISKIESLPPDFGPKGKVKAWYSRLYAQPAAYELGEDEVRQLLFDLESSYNEFISTIR